MELEIIKKVNIIENFINKTFNIECGLYEVETIEGRIFIVQTGDDYKAIEHYVGEGSKLEEVTDKFKKELKIFLGE